MNGEEPTNSVEAPPELSTSAVQSFKCKKCGREFSKAQALQTHVTRAHTKFWSSYRKPEESASVRGPGRNAKHRKGSKVCPVCKKRFAKFYLSQHMRTQHGQSLREYRNGQTSPAPSAPSGRAGRPRGTGNKTCPVCKRTFSSRPNMTLHLRKMHGKSITEFQERGGRPLDAQEAASESPRAARPTPAKKAEGREVVFCPVCGTNIHAVRTAVNFADH